MAYFAMLLIRLLELYQLLVLAYVILSWFNAPMGGLVRLVHKLVEPALIPVRRLMYRFLSRRWTPFDWSPLILWILISLAQTVLRGLFL